MVYRIGSPSLGDPLDSNVTASIGSGDRPLQCPRHACREEQLMMLSGMAAWTEIATRRRRYVVMGQSGGSLLS
jgi:hypothetical protein